MKKKLIIVYILAVVCLLITAGCGKSIGKMQEFLPNEGPVVSGFNVQYIGPDSNYKSTNLYSGMPFQITVEAKDPENKKLDYILTSTQGTFGNMTVTDSGFNCKFYIGSIIGGDTVRVTLVVKDPKNATFTQSYDIGAGKTGPGITLTPPSTSVITPAGDAVMKLSVDCKGIYRVYRDNSVKFKDQAVLGSSVTLYDGENEEIEISILGPSSSKSDGVRLLAGEKNYIWIIFQDNLSQQAVEGFNMYVEGTNPRITSTSPLNDATNISKTPRCSIIFSKDMNPATISDSNIKMKSASGSNISIDVTYDSATYTATVVPKDSLISNVKYTVTISKSVADTVLPSGNNMLDDYGYSFTTVPDGLIPNTECNPAAGTYLSGQSVALSCSEPDTTILYTTDDSVPRVSQQGDGSYVVNNGTIYSSPLAVNSNCIIQSLAFKNGSIASIPVSSSFYIRANAPVFTESIINTDTGACTLSMSTDTNGSIIYYTDDGSDPAGSSGKMLGSGQTISINKNMTIKAIAKKTGMANSEETAKTWNIRTTSPAFSLPEASFDSDTNLYLTADSGAVIYYKWTKSEGTDPADPINITSSPVLFQNSFVLAGRTGVKTIYKVQAFAVKDGMTNSLPSKVMKFIVDFSAVETPIYSLTDSVYATDEKSVVIKCATPGSKVTYTTNIQGLNGSGVESVTIPLTQSMSITAVATKGSMQQTTASRSYTIQVATPKISLESNNAGTPYYYEEKSVTMSCDTPGAKISYTLETSADGGVNWSAPGPEIASSTSGPVTIKIDSTQRINVWAKKGIMAQSSVATNKYILKAPAPDINNLLRITDTVYFSISCQSSGTFNIFYTTDKSTPSNTSTAYTGTFSKQLGTGITIKSIAYRSGWVDSDIKNVTFVNVTYSNTGSVSGTVPTDDNIYASGSTVTTKSNSGNLATNAVQDGMALKFGGWKRADGSSVGQTFVIGTENVVLSPRWSVLRATGTGGGIVFYDKGAYSDGWRYLEAAPVNWNGSGGDPKPIWSDAPDAWVGTSSALGSGKNNTTLIVNQSGCTSGAAKMCRTYTGGGKSDWFLPSSGELYKMYVNLKSGVDENGVTYTPSYALDGTWYWSSNEASQYNAALTPQFGTWVTTGWDDNIMTMKKSNNWTSLRPIRSF